MLLFHSQNVPSGGANKKNHVYIQTKNTKKYIDLGELKTGNTNVLRAYIPGNEYSQELGQVFFRFVGEPNRAYQFYANISVSFTGIMPTFTDMNDMSPNKAQIQPNQGIDVATNSEGILDFAIGIPNPHQYRTCKVQFSIISMGSMSELGQFYIGDESRWLMYLADSNLSMNPQWGDPIPLWDDITSTVPDIQLPLEAMREKLWCITRPIYDLSRSNIRATVGIVTNPQNFQWRGGNDPDTYRQMDQGSVLDLVWTSWTSKEGYKLEINKKGDGEVNFSIEIPGEHPIGKFFI